MSIAVVVDSSASLPTALIDRWGIRVVPLQVIVDGVAHAEGVEIDPDEVLARLVAGDTVTTSQPAPEAFAAAYRAAAAGGATGVVVVTLAGGLSGTVDSARVAAASSPVPVAVVDTGSVAMAVGFAAVAAAATASGGGSLDAVAEVARTTSAGARCVFTVASLDHLRRGGRISPAVAALGKVLGIRPVLEVVAGEVSLLDRVRTTARARAALVSIAADAAAQMAHPAVAVMTLGDGVAGDDAARAIAGRHPGLEQVVTSTVSAVLGVHAGPGTLAVVVADMPAGAS